MLPWTTNACSDVGKFQTSINTLNTLMTLDFEMHPIYVFTQLSSPQASQLLFIIFLWTQNSCTDVSECHTSINTLLPDSKVISMGHNIDCSDVSKCQTSINTLMTLDYKIHPMYLFRQFNSPQASHLLFFMLCYKCM